MKSPRAGYPQVSPYLYYADADAAIDWLTKSFGFTLRSAFRGPNGHVLHAELQVGASGVILIGPGMVPFGTSAVQDPDAVHASLYVYVDDIASHFARAKACGAMIRSEIQEKPHGDLIYVASDPQGQRWYFAQPK
ncbi:MAG TPA: VOC family protein [Myxococcota bacterium]|nr:VOC family protein [Myxococcota bacterium]